ncbi:MAG: hypothetical protein ACAH95_15000 [Fimbriimonas sp.]
MSVRSAAITCLILALLVTVWSVAQVLAGTEYVTTKVTVDDTYYYLLLALNHLNLGFPTYDGVNPTNGFHPLWYGIVLVLGTLFPAKEPLLQAALITAGLLASGSFWFIYAMGWRLERPALAITLAGLWFAYLVSTGAVTSGMESCTTAFCFWWAVYVYIKAFEEPKPSPLTLAMPATLLLWSRLDTAPFLLVMLVSLAVKNRAWKPYVAAASLVSLGIVAYAALMMRWNETPVPVSGIIKAGETASSIAEYGRRLANRLISIGFQRSAGEVFSLFLAVAAVVALLRTQAELFKKHKAVVAFATGAACYLALIAFTHRTVPKWYYVPTDITLLLLLAWAISADKIALTVATGAAVLFAVGSAVARFVEPMDPQHVYLARYHFARWIDANMPKDIVLGSFNAGQIGYFSNRRTVNLDGFVNSADFARTVLAGKKPLSSFLREQGITHLADYGVPDYALEFENDPYIYGVPVKSQGRDMILRIWSVEKVY